MTVSFHFDGQDNAHIPEPDFQTASRFHLPASHARDGVATGRKSPAAALILVDAALALALGWAHALPLLSLGLKRADLRKTGAELRAASHRAIVAATVEATRQATDLARRAARLQAVAPKLRAKGSEEAVAMLLASDAVAPTALSSLRSDRAARRFCDRLVELGAVRELTGHDTFRLYGI